MAREIRVEEKRAASELGERRWAVMSERGCEATRLDYGAAATLVGRLRGEGVRGLCVVTETAAARIAPAKKPAAPHAGNGAKRPPRASKK